MFYNANGHFDNWACSNYPVEMIHFLFIWEHNPNTDNVSGRFLRGETSRFQQKHSTAGAQCLTPHGKAELKAELRHSPLETGVSGGRKSLACVLQENSNSEIPFPFL